MAGDPDPEMLRIGTAEREEAGRVLGLHLGEGRLTPTEYEQRVGLAFAAHTRADLKPLFDDLPAPRPAFLIPPVELPAAPPAQPYAMPYGPPPPPPTPYGPVEWSDKSKVIAGVLQLAVPFGAGRFYTGHTGMAVAQLLVTLFTFGIGAIWPFIDGILLLANGGTDPYGRRLRD